MPALRSSIVALIWLYISWLILLLGAQLAFYVQNPQYLRPGRGEIRLNSSLRERVALSIMYLIVNDYRHARQRWTINSLAEHLDLPGAALGPDRHCAGAQQAAAARRRRHLGAGTRPAQHRAGRRARCGASRHRRSRASGRIRDIAPAVEAAQQRGARAEGEPEGQDGERSGRRQDGDRHWLVGSSIRSTSPALTRPRSSSARAAPSRSNAAARIDVGADRDDLAEHVLEIAGDRDLVHRDRRSRRSRPRSPAAPRE